MKRNMWGLTLCMLFLLTTCVPWGKQRYFQVSFVQDERDSNFEIELLLLTDYSGETAPSQPTNTLFINSSKNAPETVSYEIEKTK